MGFLLRMAITAFGLWLAARLVPGIQITPDATLALAALLLGFVNAFVRPIAIFLTFPITLVTLGLFLWVVNAGMLGLVAWMLQDFQIASLGAALIGSLVVSLTSWLGSSFIGSSGRYEVMVVRRG
ncbi:MAG: phage holin family protein [Deltaproteobacteria bacterium]|nr:phage holin family protein [Deltaproteobacteria bacterium]MBW2394700.1 phage holin family protein [Deltaproteobacteria bacterium]